MLEQFSYQLQQLILFIIVKTVQSNLTNGFHYHHSCRCSVNLIRQIIRFDRIFSHLLHQLTLCKSGIRSGHIMGDREIYHRIHQERIGCITPHKSRLDRQLVMENKRLRIFGALKIPHCISGSFRLRKLHAFTQ